MKKDTKTKKSTVPMSLCIRTHDQLILPIFGPILTSSSRAQSTIYFCTLSIRHLINSTPKSTTFYSSPAGYFGICEMKFQKKFNGWFKPPLPTVKIFLVDIDVKKKRKKCLCANMLRPEMSLDRIASKVDRIVSCLWIVITEEATDLRFTWGEETKMNILHHKRWNF